MPVELTAQPRAELGKQNNKHLRQEGRLPANLYGKGIDGSLSLTLDLKEAEKVIREHGKAGDYSLSVDGKSYAVAIKEVQRGIIKKEFVHVDFHVKGDG